MDPTQKLVAISGLLYVPSDKNVAKVFSMFTEILGENTRLKLDIERLNSQVLEKKIHSQDLQELLDEIDSW